jgi:hypothetical protein
MTPTSASEVLVPPLPADAGDLPPASGYTGTRTMSSRPARIYPPASPHRLRAGGNGIVTVCPSPTPRGLGLGPTNPEWMNLPQEPLGFRRAGFSPAFYATHTGILTSGRSSTPSGIPSLQPERSPTDPSFDESHSFGAALEPRYIVGAGTLDQ